MTALRAQLTMSMTMIAAKPNPPATANRQAQE
jgi:hypothetical protein